MAAPSISKDSTDNVYMERLDTEDPHMEKRVLRKVSNRPSDESADVLILTLAGGHPSVTYPGSSLYYRACRSYKHIGSAHLRPRR